MGLYDGVLIKNNHLAVLSSGSPKGTHPVIYTLSKLDRLRNRKRINVEIEVKNLSEFTLALPFRPDIIMLDNMGLKDIHRAVALRNRLKLPRPKLEVSGGVNLNNIGLVARIGVDFISVGAITHSAPALDISMKIIT